MITVLETAVTLRVTVLLVVVTPTLGCVTQLDASRAGRAVIVGIDFYTGTGVCYKSGREPGLTESVCFRCMAC